MLHSWCLSSAFSLPSFLFCAVLSFFLFHHSLPLFLFSCDVLFLDSGLPFSLPFLYPLCLFLFLSPSISSVSSLYLVLLLLLILFLPPALSPALSLSPSLSLHPSLSLLPSDRSVSYGFDGDAILPSLSLSFSPFFADDKMTSPLVLLPIKKEKKKRRK